MKENSEINQNDSPCEQMKNTRGGKSRKHPSTRTFKWISAVFVFILTFHTYALANRESPAHRFRPVKNGDNRMLIFVAATLVSCDYYKAGVSVYQNHVWCNCYIVAWTLSSNPNHSANLKNGQGVRKIHSDTLPNPSLCRLLISVSLWKATPSRKPPLTAEQVWATWVITVMIDR